MLMLFIVAAVAVLNHELGHAFFQRLFGVPVERIVWGRGPRLIRLGKLEVRLIPLAGAVMPAGPLLVQKRWQGVLIALGGMIFSWIVVLTLYVTQTVRIPFLSQACVDWLFLAFLDLLNLIPVGQQDGKWALEALRRKA